MVKINDTMKTQTKYILFVFTKQDNLNELVTLVAEELTPISYSPKINYFYDNYYNGVGFLRSSVYAKLVKCSTDTALRDLQDLVSKEMLKIENKGKKTNYIIVSPKGIRIPQILQS